VEFRNVSTVKELCEFIWYLEKKYNLFEFDIDGVKVWQIIRLRTYYEIAEFLGIFSVSTDHKIIRTSTIGAVVRFLNSIIFNNPFFSGKSHVVVNTHCRSKYVDGEAQDIYTFLDIRKWRAEGKRVVELEDSYFGKHLRKGHPQRKHVDFIAYIVRYVAYFMKIMGRFRGGQKNEQVKARWSEVLSEIFSVTGYRAMDYESLTREVRHFNVTKTIYKAIFRAICPEQLVVIVAYLNCPIVSAAKDLGIKSIEMQHGTFSEYHLGYSYPEKSFHKFLDYFPDEFHVWNEYWKNLIRLPLDDSSVKVVPFAYLESEIEKRKNLEKQKNTVIILSQGVLGNNLAGKILENITFFNQMIVRFKLHPGEYARAADLPNVVSLSKCDNVEILKDCDLYHYLAISEYQCGVFSTSVYEGVEFGCKTILLNLPGIEYMSDFIKFHKLEQKNDFYLPSDLFEKFS
jgi:hypothetical protein